MLSLSQIQYYNPVGTSHELGLDLVLHGIKKVNSSITIGTHTVLKNDVTNQNGQSGITSQK